MTKCWCYEKFKDKIPEGIETKCFKEKCNNWRSHNMMDCDRCGKESSHLKGRLLDAETATFEYLCPDCDDKENKE